MNPAQITALFSGIVAVIGAGFAGYLKVRGSLRTIHALVNSNLTAALAKVDALQQTVADLQRQQSENALVSANLTSAMATIDQLEHTVRDLQEKLLTKP